MTRYIDLDKLLKGLEDELKDKNPNDIAYLVFKLFIGRLNYEPTADVVPMSEVAREIFGEIYKSVASKIPMEIRPIFKDDRDFDVGFINGRRDALLDVLVLIAELKKKYTEETK